MGQSSVSDAIRVLSARSDLEALAKLAEFTRQDTSRAEELDLKLADLKSRDVPKRIAGLEQDVRDLRSLVQALTKTSREIGKEAELAISIQISDLNRTREQAERVGSDQFRFEKFTQVGTTTWREFISAARRLAQAETQGQAHYPREGEAC